MLIRRSKLKFTCQAKEQLDSAINVSGKVMLFLSHILVHSYHNYGMPPVNSGNSLPRLSLQVICREVACFLCALSFALDHIMCRLCHMLAAGIRASANWPRCLKLQQQLLSKQKPPHTEGTIILLLLSCYMLQWQGQLMLLKQAMARASL